MNIPSPALLRTPKGVPGFDGNIHTNGLDTFAYVFLMFCGIGSTTALGRVDGPRSFDSPPPLYPLQQQREPLWRQRVGKARLAAQQPEADVGGPRREQNLS